MWELDYKESWALKNWCFWTVVLEKTFKSPLDCKEIQPVYLKGNQSWIFIGRTDAEAETPILWLPDVKNWLIGKDPDVGKDWRQEEKGMTEDKMVRWHHRLDGVWVNSGRWWWTGRPGMLQSLGLQSWTQLSDWTELKGDSSKLWGKEVCLVCGMEKMDSLGHEEMMQGRDSWKANTHTQRYSHKKGEK